MLDSKLFSISWILGRFCNYKCSYCWPYANTQKPDYLEYNTYLKATQSIKKQAIINGFDRFHWSFSGGEPTAYKHIAALISEVAENSSIHMTTNLSPGFAWWSAWLLVTDTCSRRSLTASFHDEFANENEFADKILYLMSEKTFVTVNQVMVPEKFYELYERLEKFHSVGINVTLKPQSDSTASSIVNGYTPDMIDKMRSGFPQHVDEQELLQVRLIDNDNKSWYIDQAERFNSFGFNKFSGWECNSGYQSVIIRGNDVKRSYSCHDIPLGTLTDGFNLFNTPKICTTPSCVSSADSKIPKVKL
jgi:organic radical activating enzyme